MPAKVSRTLQVLMEIRDDARAFKRDVNERFGRVDERFERVDQRFERLENVLVQEFTAQRQVLEQIADLLRVERGRYGTRIDDHERRLKVLERRTGVRRA